MNGTYYLIRLAISGYTNFGGFKLFTFTGIAGSVYIGTFIYILKRIVIYHKKDVLPQIFCFISMTIVVILLIVITNKNYLPIINHNLFYNMDLGIIIGFVVGIFVTKVIKRYKYKIKCL